MAIDTQLECDCGYYVDADGEGDTGTVIVSCRRCGQRWQVEWRVYWEREGTDEATDD